MKPKLYIINNGLKDLRGHYFETSVSIAEAGQKMGLDPLLAGHVTCPPGIVPEAIEFHAAFTTDHWMVDKPPAQPDLRGLRAELPLLANGSIESLKNGTIGFDEFLAARFFPDAAGAPGGRVALRLRASDALRSGRQLAKEMAKGMLPLEVRKFVRHHLHTSFPQIRRRFARHLQAARVPTPAERLQQTLDSIGLPHETGHSKRFGQDLERLLCLTRCSAHDHIFLPTAHGRELVAVLELQSSWPVDLQPTFHLEFRHAVASTSAEVGADVHPYVALHRAFFAYARTFPVNHRLRLYTDSEGLSDEYEYLSGYEFDVLPIPFRTHLVERRLSTERRVCIGYLGDVRDEKGFHWLPLLVQDMLADYVRTGKVTFLIQSSLVHPEHEPLSRGAIEKLKECSQEAVQLVGLSGPLSPESYYRLVSDTDLLVCPYDPAIYKNRTSGTLAEAISAGIPTVVPHGSWLSRQQPPGSGKTFSNLYSFIESVKSICDDYPRYLRAAKAGRECWMTRHSPESLIRALVRQPDEKGSSSARVA